MGLFEYRCWVPDSNFVPFPNNRIVLRKLKFGLASGCCLSVHHTSKTGTCVNPTPLCLRNHTLKTKHPGTNWKRLFFFFKKHFNYMQSSEGHRALLLFLCVHLARAEILLFASFLENRIVKETIRLVKASSRKWLFLLGLFLLASRKFVLCCDEHLLWLW